MKENYDNDGWHHWLAIDDVIVTRERDLLVVKWRLRSSCELSLLENCILATNLCSNSTMSTPSTSGRGAFCLCCYFCRFFSRFDAIFCTATDGLTRIVQRRRCHGIWWLLRKGSYVWIWRHYFKIAVFSLNLVVCMAVFDVGGCCRFVKAQ